MPSRIDNRMLVGLLALVMCVMNVSCMGAKEGCSENQIRANQTVSDQLACIHDLNQYQGGMCISGSLTMTERTPRHLISPLGPSWVGTDSAV